MTETRIATIHQLPVKARLVCSTCGADGEGTCNCGMPYVPAGQRAADAIAADPTKSDRAIADDIGVSHTTVQNARKATGNKVPVEKRTGKDGKVRKLPTKKKRRDIDDYLAEKKARTVAKGEDASAPATQQANIEDCIKDTTLQDQLIELVLELVKSRDDHFERVLQWTKTFPNNEYIPQLVWHLEEFTRQMQVLAQEISGRNPDDNDEAASASAGPPVGDT